MNELETMRRVLRIMEKDLRGRLADALAQRDAALAVLGDLLEEGGHPRDLLAGVVRARTLLPEGTDPEIPGWYWYRQNYGDPWRPLEVRMWPVAYAHRLANGGTEPETVALSVHTSAGWAPVAMFAQSPLWGGTRRRWAGPFAAPPREPRQDGPRGTPEHPCEACGNTTTGHRVERGFQRCAQCGYPGQ